MSTRYGVACFICLLMFGGLVNAQVMNIHSGEMRYQVELNSIDSLTFSEESLDQITNVTVNVCNSGYDGGGAIWLLEVSAIVEEEDSHPVDDGILVEFSLYPNIATITAEVYTGNESLGGNSVQGTAFAILAYPGAVTNEIINIQATVIGADGDEIAGFLLDYVLPIQDPSIQINVDRFNYFYSGSNDNADFRTEAFVTDGHLTPINGQLVRFLSTRGEFHYSMSISSEILPEMLTGDVDEYVDINTGWARRYLVVPFEAAFPDPTNLEDVITVTSQLVGCNLYSEEIQLELAHN